MILNTKRELLAIQPFSAMALTKYEFEDKLRHTIASLFQRFNFDASQFIGENPALTEETCTNAIGEFRLALDDLYGDDRNDPYHLDKLKDTPELRKYIEDVSKVHGSSLIGSTITERMSDVDGSQDDRFTIKTLSNGFTFLQVITSSNDDNETPMLQCIYFDQFDNLRNYTPVYGNTIIPDLGYQVGWIAESYDEEKALDDFWQNLLRKTDNWGGDIENAKDCLDAYEKVYGIAYSDDDSVDEMDESMLYEYVADHCVLDVSRCMDDIVSAVTLTAKR